MSKNGENHAMNAPRSTALILAGAAGKGPYAAGALGEIANDPRFDVRSVVGASSGALNAAVYAAGLRAGQAVEAAELLCEYWEERAHWSRVLRHRDRVSVVREALEQFRVLETRKEVELHVPLATLTGALDRYRHVRFEEVRVYRTEDFCDSARLDEMAEVCVASAALPVLFPPREIGGEGPYWDGGIVNNTPVGRALQGDPTIDHVIVVTPDASVAEHRSYSRFSIARLLEMSIEERLGRDLYEAMSFNDDLVKLCKAGVDLAELRPELDWRILQFVEIRPLADPPGNALSGFFSDRRRAEYVRIGRETARERLRSWTPQPFDTTPRRSSASHRDEPRQVVKFS